MIVYVSRLLGFAIHFASAHFPAGTEARLLSDNLVVVGLVTGEQQRAEDQWIGTVFGTRTSSSRKQYKFVSGMWPSVVLFLWWTDRPHEAWNGR